MLEHMGGAIGTATARTKLPRTSEEQEQEQHTKKSDDNNKDDGSKNNSAYWLISFTKDHEN
eukprot:3174174-Amphidinium_carterae.1